jgi:replicative DNA helicase
MHEAALAVITHLINGGTPGRSTGFDAIDRMIAGLRPERFHIIGGRPGQGKTALVLAIAVAVAAAKDPGSVAFFSLEMSSEELAQRIIAARANLDLRQLLTGDLTEREHERAHEAAVWASTLPISIEEAITIEQITSRARRMHARRPLGVLIVDYIQLVMSTNMRKGANPTEVVTTISRRLKLLAKELHIPVIGLSQLNRAVETRSDKRPTLADLRESGALEQDADLVAFVHREAYYDAEHADPNAADFIIAKQRNGPTGTVPMRFVPKCARFENEA